MLTLPEKKIQKPCNLKDHRPVPVRLAADLRMTSSTPRTRLSLHTASMPLNPETISEASPPRARGPDVMAIGTATPAVHATEMRFLDAEGARTGAG
jgi:hypothetical protein